MLALGDSYTIGETVAPAERWPVQLAKLLTDAGIETGGPRIVARTGWTTDELMAAIAREELDKSHDLVTLLIGVNNQYRGLPAEEFRSEFVELLDLAIGFARGEPRRVVVLSIPDWGVTPFAEGRDRAKIAREIDRFNAIKREESSKKGVAFVDITPISRRAAAEPKLVAVDGLHPSGAMYAEWARLALPVAQEILKPQE